MPIDLYYLPLSPPCRAVLTTAKILGIDVNIKNVDLKTGQHKTPEFLKMNPNHTIPAMNDNGFVLFESRAMMAYLINKYKPDSTLYPKEANARAKVDEVLYFDASALFPALRACLISKFFKNEEPRAEDVENLKEKISVVEKLVGGKKFVTGDTFTLADVSLGVIIPAFGLVRNDLTPPGVTQYLERLYQACPALKQVNDSVVLPK